MLIGMVPDRGDKSRRSGNRHIGLIGKRAMKKRMRYLIPFIVALAWIGMSAVRGQAPSSGFGGYTPPAVNQAFDQNNPVEPVSAVTGNVNSGSAAFATDEGATITVSPTTDKTSQSGSAGQSVSSSNSGYVSSPLDVSSLNNSQNREVPPPEDYKLTENDQLRLDEFLNHWENFGKGIKRVSCDVHVMEFDGGILNQDDKIPLSHTWGVFRFITPNKLLYHVRGEFSYSGLGPKDEPVWKESSNEWKIVLDGKTLTQYDFAKQVATVFPIREEEQDLDLTMDNGQFPLFFIANAEKLKKRFYLRLVTPESKLKNEVWVAAYPRYSRDAQQFQSIIVILGLQDLQPIYMRKFGVNGKSHTDLKFQNIAINKGRWNIEGTVDKNWTRDVREETFSLLMQQPTDSPGMMPENATYATNVKSDSRNTGPGQTQHPQANAPAQNSGAGSPASKRVSVASPDVLTNQNENANNNVRRF